MAHVSYSSGTWTATGEGLDHLVPGAVHSWIAWGFGDGDAIVVSAHPGHLGGNPPINIPEEQILTVENLRTEWNPTGRRIFFDVQNTGSFAVFGYVIAYAFINK
jgi:hypothetical protein